MAQEGFRQLLGKHKVSDLPKREIIVVNSTESPYEGFKKLIKHNILSAPVFDVVKKQYTGFLDMRDLVSFVVFIHDDQVSDVPNNLQDILLHGCKLFKQPQDGVTSTCKPFHSSLFNGISINGDLGNWEEYLSRRNPFHSVSGGDTLLSVVEILAKGVHRVPVVDSKGDVINIISQTSLIAFFQKNHKELAHVTHKMISELNVGSKPVICVSQNTKAIEAFRLMDNKKISGVAVVDETGRFIGNTSASDLKLFISSPSLELLHQSILTFLNAIRQESIDIKSPTISCSSHDTLEIVIGKLASTKIHRIFVADDNSGYKPVAVVSITDILRYAVKN